jgi:hypothetical protein
MNYLSGSETQANVAVLWIVCRWLGANGPTSLPDLRAVLRPSGLVTGADDALRASLNVGVDIELLDLELDVYRLGADVQPAATGDHRTFRGVVRTHLLARAVAAGKDASDVAVGLAWLLSMNPVKPPSLKWSETETWMIRDGLRDKYAFNETKWRAFRRWAVDLGLAVEIDPKRHSGPSLLSPDPTSAVADALQGMPERLSARSFVDQLVGQLPCLDGGELEPILESIPVKSGRHYAERAGATVGPALGYALVRLERRGALRLIRADDASTRVSYILRGQTEVFDEVLIGDEVGV